MRDLSAQEVSYRWLKQHIWEIEPEEGAHLTEAAIASAAGTSRTPAREAIFRLEAEGYLKVIPRKGVFVPPISDREVEALMQAREVVEVWCICQIPLPASIVDDLALILRLQEQNLHDPVKFIEYDHQFHFSIVQAAGNPVLAEFYESLTAKQVRVGLRALAAASGRAETVIAEHAIILEQLRKADDQGNHEAVSEAMVAHLSSTSAMLRRPPGTPLTRKGSNRAMPRG